MTVIRDRNTRSATCACAPPMRGVVRGTGCSSDGLAPAAGPNGAE